MASLRPLLRPSGGFALHARQLQCRINPASRHASTTPPPKPRLLEKPERFNPPSHGRKLKANTKTVGAPLGESERQAQRRRKYPHMFPPEGTFMFWFLTNRRVHTYISVGVLIALCISIWVQDFLATTPYKDMFPPKSMLLAHPWQFFRQYWDVYEMHLMWQTKEVQERRRRKVDDVQKRAEYRKAHGLDAGENAGIFGGWTARTDQELLGPAMKPDSSNSSQAAGEDSAVVDPSTMLNSTATGSTEVKQNRRPGLLGITW